MISDFCNGVMAYTDWNVLLDENGGPNHVGNFCFAPVHYNTKTGKLTYTPTFYYIGHFSRFVRPGARRISSSVSRTTLQSVSFANTDGSIVTVVMNKSDMEVSYKFFVDKSMTEMVIKPHAIQSIVYRLPQ
jgi:glucosylceramidase